MQPGWQLLTLEIIDYFVQATLFTLGFIYPWFVPREHGRRVFRHPILLSFLWCMWRMGLFDPAINNDVPGIGYLVVGLMLGLIASALYRLRCFLTRSTHGPDDTKVA